MVAVLKVGNEWDPRQFTDITLTAYRDAIDFLGYYRDGHGSMVDGIGAESHLSRRLVADRVGKVKGFASIAWAIRVVTRVVSFCK